MAPRLATFALAACLTLGAASCGGDDEDGGANAPPAASEPATQERAEPGGRSDPGAAREQEPAGSPQATAPDTDTDTRPEPAPRERERAATEPRPSLTQAQRVVRTVVGMISRADPAVCRRFFTQRYANLVSGLKGERAFRKCESDIGRSKGTLEVTGFGRSRVRGRSALVRFTMDVAGQSTSQGWSMVFEDGGWMVDGRA